MVEKPPKFASVNGTVPSPEKLGEVQEKKRAEIAGKTLLGYLDEKKAESDERKRQQAIEDTFNSLRNSSGWKKK